MLNSPQLQLWDQGKNSGDVYFPPVWEAMRTEQSKVQYGGGGRTIMSVFLDPGLVQSLEQMDPQFAAHINKLLQPER